MWEEKYESVGFISRKLIIPPIFVILQTTWKFIFFLYRLRSFRVVLWGMKKDTFLLFCCCFLTIFWSRRGYFFPHFENIERKIRNSLEWNGFWTKKTFTLVTNKTSSFSWVCEWRLKSHQFWHDLEPLTSTVSQSGLTAPCLFLLFSCWLTLIFIFCSLLVCSLSLCRSIDRADFLCASHVLNNSKHQISGKQFHSLGTNTS